MTNRVNGTIRKRINAGLYEVCKNYQPHIPLDNIRKVLEREDLLLLQEDNTSWAGLLCGADAHANFDLGFIGSQDKDGRYTVVKNCSLHLSWYKMPSGRYELTAYVL